VPGAAPAIGENTMVSAPFGQGIDDGTAAE
jgi:hypothetical protein